MNNKVSNAVLSGVSIICIGNIVGHFLPPLSMFGTPIYMVFIIILINKPLYRLSFLRAIIYNCILLLANDLLLRYFAGGNHDSEGKAWITLIFLLSSIISFVFMIDFAAGKYSAIDKEKKGKNLLICLSGAILTATIYWNFFTDL